MFVDGRHGVTRVCPRQSEVRVVGVPLEYSQSVVVYSFGWTFRSLVRDLRVRRVA